VPRRSITVRFPATLVDDARKRTAPDESFNDLVVAAVEREARRRSALATLERINELRRKVWGRAGKQPSSAPLIRQMREERLRRG